MTKLEWIRTVLFQYIGSLFMEPDASGRNVMSLGRVALAGVLSQAMWQWHYLDRDIVTGMKESLFALMAYNFGSKGIQTVKDGIAAWQGVKAPAAGVPDPAAVVTINNNPTPPAQP